MERFGIRLTKKEYKDIVRAIVNYVCKPIYIDNEDGKSFHSFNVQGCECVFLFDWEYNCLQTVYRKSWFNKLDESNYEPRVFRRTSKSVRARDKALTLYLKYHDRALFVNHVED